MERSYRRGAPACDAVVACKPRAIPGLVYQTLHILAAITLGVLLLAVLAAIGGCSRPAVSVLACAPARSCHAAGLCLARSAPPRASLIFPAEPGLTPIPADQIARADWPTAPGLTDYGQTVNYQEYWYDAQGLGPFDVNFGYRTFMSWRTGQMGQ